MAWFTKLHRALKETGEGWHYDGAYRLAARAHARVGLIYAIQRNDFHAFLKFSRSEMIHISQELSWLPMLMKQANLISHDANRTYEGRK